jgi:hypothetical protein
MAAAIRFRKTGTNQYDYRIYEPGEAEYEPVAGFWSSATAT